MHFKNFLIKFATPKSAWNWFCRPPLNSTCLKSWGKHRPRSFSKMTLMWTTLLLNIWRWHLVMLLKSTKCSQNWQACLVAVATISLSVVCTSPRIVFAQGQWWRETGQISQPHPSCPLRCPYTGDKLGTLSTTSPAMAAYCQHQPVNISVGRQPFQQRWQPVNTTVVAEWQIRGIPSCWPQTGSVESFV